MKYRPTKPAVFFHFYTLSQLEVRLPVEVRQAGGIVWPRSFSRKVEVSPQINLRILTSGNMHCRINGEERLLTPGALYVEKPGDSIIHRTGSAGFAGQRVIGLEGEAAFSVLAAAGLCAASYFELPHPERVVSQMRRMSVTMRRQEFDVRQQLSLMAYELILILASELNKDAYPMGIRKAIAYIQKDLSRRPELSLLAKAAGVSPTHLSRLFKAHLGQSPIEYWNATKLEYARECLRDTGWNVSQVADRLGYSSPYYFSSVFKKYFGYAPRLIQAGIGRRPASANPPSFARADMVTPCPNPTKRHNHPQRNEPHRHPNR